jgi:3-oxoacyl-[acyl-carrier-protein] synthase II
LNTAFGGQVTNFDGKRYVVPRKSLKVMTQEIQWSYAAAKLACEEAGIGPGSVDPDRFSVLFGADMFYSDPEELIEAFRNSVEHGRFNFDRWGEHALSSIFPLWMLKYLPNMVACQIAIAHDARGPNNTITLGEVSSLVAMREAMLLIERDAADVVITGGASNGLNRFAWVARQVHHSRRAEDPAGACRPFDADRDGVVWGAGGAAMIFESREHAARRRARVLARPLAAAHGWRPMDERRRSPDTLDRIISQTLSAAGLTPKDLGFVIAHGFGTREHDRREAQAIRAVLGDTPVAALKGYIGCLNAAAGAVESALALIALEQKQAPFTLNYQRPDPDCPLNIIRDRPAPLATPNVLVLSQSTMGQVAALLLAGEESGG